MRLYIYIYSSYSALQTAPLTLSSLGWDIGTQTNPSHLCHKDAMLILMMMIRMMIANVMSAMMMMIMLQIMMKVILKVMTISLPVQ